MIGFIRYLGRNIVIAVLMAGLFAGSSVRAAEPPGMKAYVDASTELLQLIKAAQDGGELPRKDDAKAGPLLRRLSDAAAVFGTQRYGKDDIPSLLTICGQSNAVNVTYLMAGTPKLRELLKKQPINPTEIMLAQEEAARQYQDEVIPLMGFSVACMGKAVPALGEFWKTLKPEQVTDIRRQGVKQFQLGAKQLIIGSVVVGGDKSYSLANRVLLLRAVAEHVGSVAGAIPLADRQLIQTNLEMTRKNAPPELEQSLESIVRSLSRTDCDDLCKL